MQVTYRKHCQPQVEYHTVKRGEVFWTRKTGDKVFIKSDRDGFSGKTAVSLNTGETYSFSGDEKVQLVDCEVVVG